MQEFPFTYCQPNVFLQTPGSKQQNVEGLNTFPIYLKPITTENVFLLIRPVAYLDIQFPVKYSTDQIPAVQTLVRKTDVPGYVHENKPGKL